jgi:hypothetical protein
LMMAFSALSRALRCHEVDAKQGKLQAWAQRDTVNLLLFTTYTAYPIKASGCARPHSS